MTTVWTPGGSVPAALFRTYETKHAAQQQARRMRKRGINAWVWVTDTGWWNVWTQLAG